MAFGLGCSKGVTLTPNKQNKKILVLFWIIYIHINSLYMVDVSLQTFYSQTKSSFLRKFFFKTVFEGFESGIHSQRAPE